MNHMIIQTSSRMHRITQMKKREREHWRTAIKKEFNDMTKREYVVDGMVEIVFVPSEENDSDIFTKNV